jgi:hypothetical protein
MEDSLEKLGDKSDLPQRDAAGRLLPGQRSLNPKGRPRGKTLKEFAREYLLNLSDLEKTRYLKELPPEIVWRMAEGNPHQTTDNQTEVTLPKPLLDALKPTQPEDSG